MPKIVDTTIRLLSQEPLAGKLPTGEVLRIAEILDTAGFACLEVSGGGVFDSAVRRAGREPVGADPRDRRAHDDAARPRAPRPLPRRLATRSRADIVRRFVSCAAENGIDVFRLHDPLNDVSNLLEAGEAIVAAGKEFHVGLVYSAGRERRDRRARRAREAAARRSARRASIVNDPTDALAAAPHRGARRSASARRPGCPSGSTCRAPAGRGSLNARRRDARRRRPRSRRAVYPLALDAPPRLRASRSSTRSHGLGRDTGVDTAPAVGGRRRRSTSTSATSPSRPWRRASPCAPPSTTSRPASSPRSTCICARTRPATACSTRSPRSCRIRAEAGWPPLASPIGQILASQALLNVLSARRYGTVLDEFRLLVEGGYGTTPAPIEPSGRARRRARHRQRRRPRRGSAERRGRARSGRRARRERGGPRPARDVRRGGRDAAAVDPRSGTRARRRCCSATSTRRGPSGSASSSRSCRSPASGRSRSRTRACASRSAGPTRPAVSRGAARGDPRGRRGRAPEPPAARRCASSRRWSASSTASSSPGGARVRRGRRRRQRRPDAVPARGDEALQRAQGRAGGPREGDPRRERPARRVRPAALRARAGRRASRSSSDVLPRPRREPG